MVAAVAAALLLLAAPAGAEPVSAEAEFVVHINALRAGLGLMPLAVDSQLRGVARAWSAEMARQGDISHRPDLPNVVSNWRLLGENVGVGQTAGALHAAFVNSPHHYENLVTPDFQFVGIGVVEQGGRMWVTENFKRAGGAAASSPTTKPVPTTTPATAAAPRTAPSASSKPTAAPRPPAPVAPAPTSTSMTTTTTTVTVPPTTPTSVAAAAQVKGTSVERDGNRWRGPATALAAVGVMIVLGVTTNLGRKRRSRIQP